MESAALSSPLFTISRTPPRLPSTLARRFSIPLLPPHRARCIHLGASPAAPKDWFLATVAAHYLLHNSSSPAPLRFAQLASISSSPAAFGSGGGGDGSAGGTGGDEGDGGFGGGETKTKSLAGESDEVSAVSPDVIILDVGGMTCGGCSASVKRILENQPQVSSATVNLATETAVIWVKPEVQNTQNWKHQVGEKLANHLTNCGFKSNLRGQKPIAEGDLSYPMCKKPLNIFKKRMVLQVESDRAFSASATIVDLERGIWIDWRFSCSKLSRRILRHIFVDSCRFINCNLLLDVVI